MSKHMPSRENGSTLFVALVLLLVITLLALSGAREVALESRITGNLLEQQQLFNGGEAALREGEKQLTNKNKPVEPACSSDDDAYCLRNEAANYAPDFEGDTMTYAGIDGDLAEAEWYAIPAPSGASEGQSENPEYGNMMMGIGTFRYEVNVTSKNSATDRMVNLRSTTAKVFN